VQTGLRPVQRCKSERRFQVEETRYQVSGLGRLVPGSGVQHQVQVQGLHPYPNPTTHT